MIIESKSQPVELDNSAIECAVEAKEKLEIIWNILFCGFCLRFDMTFDDFDVTLRDYSSFGKLTNSCN